MSARFGVSMLAIKNLDEKCEIVRARWSQAVALDRDELFLYRRAQIFFFECQLPAELNLGCRLRLFLLLFRDDVLLFLFFFSTRNIDRGLRRQRGGHRQTAPENKKNALHHRKRIRYFTIPRYSPPTHRSPITTNWSLML